MKNRFSNRFDYYNWSEAMIEVRPIEIVKIMKYVWKQTFGRKIITRLSCKYFQINRLTLEWTKAHTGHNSSACLCDSCWWQSICIFFLLQNNWIKWIYAKNRLQEIKYAIERLRETLFASNILLIETLSFIYYFKSNELIYLMLTPLILFCLLLVANSYCLLLQFFA